MDPRLLKAAWEGNVADLLHFLKEDPKLLHEVAVLSSSDTPLHVASMAGHLDFVKEVIKLRPEFAIDLNKDGLAPIHLASAIGHEEIVKELLELNPNQQARLQGKDRKTALHIAASKGRIGVINMLVSSCPECVEDETIRGETALHLAVKNKQFKAMRAIVEKLMELGKEEMLNQKDKEEGSTILHLSASSKQLDVVQFLLDYENAKGEKVVTVNALDHNNLTALDILLLCPSEAGDREITETLRHAGGQRAREIINASSSVSINVYNDNNYQNDYNNHQISIQRTGKAKIISKIYKLIVGAWDCMNKFIISQQGGESRKDSREMLLVVATLIATTTYQAGLSPPGGLWQDDHGEGKKHYAGEAIMDGALRGLFSAFVFFNGIGFYCSMYVISILIHGLPMNLELQCCLLGMTVNFIASMQAIIPDANRSASVLNVVSPAAALLLFLGVGLWNKGKNELKSLSQKRIRSRSQF